MITAQTDKLVRNTIQRKQDEATQWQTAIELSANGVHWQLVREMCPVIVIDKKRGRILAPESWQGQIDRLERECVELQEVLINGR